MEPIGPRLAGRTAGLKRLSKMELNIFAAAPSYIKQRPMMAASRADAKPEMCDKCVKLDDKIERYQYLSSQTTDPPTLDGIKKLIADLQAQKTALHPEQTG